MQDYRNLRVWQKAHQLGIDAYALPPYLQEPKGWALRDQMLKAVISISSNVAEGAGRGSDPDFARFLWYSMGSCNEFESDLLLGGQVKLIPASILSSLADEVSDVRRDLTRLIQTVEESSRKPGAGSR
jgi:four helix bundle protein